MKHVTLWSGLSEEFDVTFSVCCEDYQMFIQYLHGVNAGETMVHSFVFFVFSMNDFDKKMILSPTGNCGEANIARSSLFVNGYKLTWCAMM